jgi:thiamine biosynthesis lipoprotein
VTPRVVLAVLTAAIAAGGPLLAGDRLVHREAYLMGTRALLAASAPDPAAGHALLERALDILQDTEAELSTWRADSALSRLNRQPVGEPWQASPAICRLFTELYAWQRDTGAAFDPALGRLLDAWGIRDAGRVPSASELANAREGSGLMRIDFDRAACTLVRRAAVALDPGAFGKGEGLDRVAAALGTQTWLVDLGGQVSVGVGEGGDPWVVDIAHPHDRQRPVLQVVVRSGSLSTSGGSERDVYYDGVRVGHILDPRSGRPAPYAGSVVVWHERGLVADILSTAMFVMGPDEGLRWARARGHAVAYLMASRSGLQIAATPQFTTRLRPREVR